VIQFVLLSSIVRLVSVMCYTSSKDVCSDTVICFFFGGGGYWGVLVDKIMPLSSFQ
jgi:hypothetical protein